MVSGVAWMFLCLLVCTGTLVFGYLVGRDNAEKDAEQVVSSLRAKNRALVREADLAREDAARARRIAAQAVSRSMRREDGVS